MRTAHSQHTPACLLSPLCSTSASSIRTCLLPRTRLATTTTARHLAAQLLVVVALRWTSRTSCKQSWRRFEEVAAAVVVVVVVAGVTSLLGAGAVGDRSRPPLRQQPAALVLLLHLHQKTLPLHLLPYLLPATIAMIAMTMAAGHQCHCLHLHPSAGASRRTPAALPLQQQHQRLPKPAVRATSLLHPLMWRLMAQQLPQATQPQPPPLMLPRLVLLPPPPLAQSVE